MTSSVNYIFVEGISGSSIDDPSVTDPDCSSYISNNLCTASNVTMARIICSRRSTCAGFIFCYLFAEPFKLQESSKQNGINYEQNGYLKVGKRFVIDGVTRIAGATTTTTTTAPTSTVVTSTITTTQPVRTTTSGTPPPTEPASTSTSSFPLVPVAIGITAGILLIGAAIAAFFFFRKRSTPKTPSTPYSQSSGLPYGGNPQQGAAPMNGGYPQQGAAPMNGGYPQQSAAPMNGGYPQQPMNGGYPQQGAAPMNGGYPQQGAAPMNYPQAPAPGMTSPYAHAAPLAPAPMAHPQAQYMPVAPAVGYAAVGPKEDYKGERSEKMAIGNSALFTHSMSSVPVFDWTPDIVGSWLSSKGFPSYVGQTLSANDINGTRLLLLTESKLQSLGVTSPEVCHAIRTCVDQLREESAASSAAPSASAGGDVPPPYIPGGDGAKASDRKTPAFREL
ncbi:hypothetical protein HDU67_008314 [Dinochytrium kinnereticum]|nr:hypothetical protein HDU67_008314 [Dinochytrium kinnereticum]